MSISIPLKLIAIGFDPPPYNVRTTRNVNMPPHPTPPHHDLRTHANKNVRFTSMVLIACLYIYICIYIYRTYSYKYEMIKYVDICSIACRKQLEPFPEWIQIWRPTGGYLGKKKACKVWNLVTLWPVPPGRLLLGKLSWKNPSLKSKNNNGQPLVHCTLYKYI